jgi:DNA-binding NtrC family response regulator
MPRRRSIGNKQKEATFFASPGTFHVGSAVSNFTAEVIVALFDRWERRFATILSQLINCNPFHPRWVELEREALGPAFREAPPVYHRQAEWDESSLHPNIMILGEHTSRLTEQARRRLAEGMSATDAESRWYEDLALYHLYRNCYAALDEAVLVGPRQTRDGAVAVAWDRFVSDYHRFFRALGREFPEGHQPKHVFACFFQMRRAFHHIYSNILGLSKPAATLRGAVWQSIFTHDMRRWARTLAERMGNLPTLITGPSGTGKELVARAVGLSRFIPFDPASKKFRTDFAGSFYPLNLAALPPTLIESELFGHKKGAFTGAVEDRTGWLEECEKNYGCYGTVFLDEIGELDASIQVKLLRVLQTGVFHRLGESKERSFSGKIISATNRDLAAEMRAGRFREDFYYRLCADRITTPSLREQLADAPNDLYNLLLFIARREIGDTEAEGLARETKAWIDANLAHDYPWPGNFRELEQCLRNVMIRQSYQPARLAGSSAPEDPRQALATAVIDGSLTLAELERRYSTLVYAQTDSYQEAAQRLDCDWRTLRSKIDSELLRQLKQT